MGTATVTSTELRSGRKRSSRRRPLVGAALLAGVVAVAGYRFTTASSGEPAPARPGAPSAPVVPPPGTGSALTARQAEVAARPTDGHAWLGLAGEATRAAIDSGDPADYELASTAVSRATSLLPGDHRPITVDGVLALSKHDFARAAVLGGQAAALAPEDAEALGILVDADVELGRYEDAAAELDRMAARRPGGAALARVSYLRELHGDLPGALVAMSQAVTASGTTGEQAATSAFLAELQLSTGDLDAAGDTVAKALVLAPQRVPTALIAARVDAARGDLAAATDRLEAVLERSPQPAVASLLGELRQREGDRAGADRAFALVRADLALLDAAGVTTDLEAAVYEADHGDPVRAVERATAAYDARDTVFTSDALGWALVRAGRASEAMPYVESSLRLSTRAVALRVHAAVALHANGDDRRAADQLGVAFQGSPWSAPALVPAALDLARQLGVAVPASWSPS
jgi:tetratricopeptide (TPR) repeat protein